MLKNIVRAARKTDIEYELCFDDGHDNNGFQFPCDKGGKVKDDISPEAECEAFSADIIRNSNKEAKAGTTSSHSEKEILNGCIELMQQLVGRFEEYLDYIDFHPQNEEERFATSFYMTEIVERLFLWGTSHSGGTSQRMKMKELGVTDETVVFRDDREKEN